MGRCEQDYRLAVWLECNLRTSSTRNKPARMGRICRGGFLNLRERTEKDYPSITTKHAGSAQSQPGEFLIESGAGHEIRTRDFNLGKVREPHVTLRYSCQSRNIIRPDCLMVCHYGSPYPIKVGTQVGTRPLGSIGHGHFSDHTASSLPLGSSK